MTASLCKVWKYTIHASMQGKQYALPQGFLTTSQISHLLLYPSLWLLLSGLSSQFLPLLPIQPAFIVNSGWQYL